MNRNRHCAVLTRVPAVAQSAGEIKYQALGDLFVAVELMQRSAPWGISFKGSSGSGSTTTPGTGGGIGGGIGGGDDGGGFGGGLF
jgi:hypothetical protein